MLAIHARGVHGAAVRQRRPRVRAEAVLGAPVRVAAAGPQQRADLLDAGPAGAGRPGRRRGGGRGRPGEAALPAHRRGPEGARRVGRGVGAGGSAQGRVLRQVRDRDFGRNRRSTGTGRGAAHRIPSVPAGSRQSPHRDPAESHCGAPDRGSGAAPEGRPGVARPDRAAARDGRSPGMSVLLEARQVVKRYDGSDLSTPALAGVDVRVERGEFVAVMGPSGCGKSTMLNILAGLDRPTDGEVWFEGRRIDRLGETELAKLRRRRIGFVFQSFNLLPTLSVAENVELPLLLVGQRRGTARRTAAALLDDLGVAERRWAAPGRLSGGQQQRVALARALANDPDLVLADEPTGNLDSGSTRDVLGLLRAAHRRGRTLLVATHDARVAAAADRLLRMSDGRIV